MRKFFGKSIRKTITDFFYPEKMKVEDFVEELGNALEAFKNNMNHLDIPREQFVESWMETLCSWMEIEQEESNRSNFSEKQHEWEDHDKFAICKRCGAISSINEEAPKFCE